MHDILVACDQLQRVELRCSHSILVVSCSKTNLQINTEARDLAYSDGRFQSPVQADAPLPLSLTLSNTHKRVIASDAHLALEAIG